MLLKQAAKLAALPFAHLRGIAPRSERDDGPSAEEIARREAEEAALRAAPLAGIQPVTPKAEDPATDPVTTDPPTDRVAILEEENAELRRQLDAANAPDAGGETGDSASDTEENAAGHRFAAARARERARCMAIFNDPAAGISPDLAAQQAFHTTATREVAIATVQAGSKGRTRLDARMTAAGATAALTPAPAPKSDRQTIDDGWDAAVKAVRR